MNICKSCKKQKINMIIFIGYKNNVTFLDNTSITDVPPITLKILTIG